jgi:hypothetical protein
LWGGVGGGGNGGNISDYASIAQRSPRIQGCGNHAKHTPDILRYFIIGETHHGISTAFDPSLPLSIAVSVITNTMHSAVDLNNKLRAVTKKIGDVRPEWRLPPEMRAFEREMTKLRPQRTFGSRHFAS